MALEQLAGYRFHTWGGTSPGRRARIAASLPEVDYLAWYLQVARSWTSPAETTTAAADAAA